jgi:hypothetical protein
MVDYEDHAKMREERANSQDVNDDMRESSRAQIYFVEKEDGQWDPDVITKMTGKPRYTDDRCNPILDSICGEIEDNEFAIKISPASGDSSKETAEIFEGLIRNIENISSASLIYSSMARMMVTCGMSGVELEQGYVDGDSFNQDLFIREIPDFQNRVWFAQSSIKQDNSDAPFVFVDEYITKEEHEKRFDSEGDNSLDSGARSNVYADRPDVITISRFYYKSPIKIDIVQMSDGSVYKDDEDLAMLIDELMERGITETGRRTRETFKVYQRYMDSEGWLNEAEETVFELLPVFGCYANHKVIDGKAIVRGAIAKAMDQQRVHNMAFSREVEEVVLSPRAKFWGTPAMRLGHEKTLNTLNTNSHPWQDMNYDPSMPNGPLFIGGAQINQGLSQLSMSSAQSIDLAAGAFSPALANNANLQSGIALDKQIEKANTSTVKYYKSVQVTLTAMAKCLVNCIPRSYDSTRQQRILGEDGAGEMVTLNEVIIDQQTGQEITLNNLTLGQYDVNCDYGPAFKSRQEKSSEAFATIAQLDPTIMELARDVWLSNINEPGMKTVAERSRSMQIKNGIIPFEQLTSEEQQQAQQQANQPPQPDPNMLIAEAEMGKAQAEQLSAQTKQEEAQGNMQLKAATLQLENRKLALAEQEQQLDVAKFQREKDDKYNVDAANIQQNQEKIDLQSQNQQFTQMLAMQKQLIESQKAQAETLKALKDAMGAEAIMNQSAVKAYDNVAEDLAKEDLPSE